jgi:hypothetical protein
MALLKKSEEEKRLREHEKQARAKEKDRQRETAARERLRKDFYKSPPGRARAAYELGAKVFQYEIDLQNVQATVVPMMTATAKRTRTNDASEILSAVCDEGWELVNGSFVFVQTGSESRDKFMASGQQVAVRGTTVGYYLFKRNEENLLRKVDPWNVQDMPEDELSGVE